MRDDWIRADGARDDGNATMTMDEPPSETEPSTGLETPPFVIVRRTGLYGALAVAALVVAAGFAWLAYDRSVLWLWFPAAVLAVFGLVPLPGLRDPRTPLFVADDHGVRMRHDGTWIGLLWSEMGEIRVERRVGLLQDARVKVISRDGLHVYRAPVGFATNVSPGEAEVQLARRRSAAAY